MREYIFNVCKFLPVENHHQTNKILLIQVKTVQSQTELRDYIFFFHNWIFWTGFWLNVSNMQWFLKCVYLYVAIVLECWNFKTIRKYMVILNCMNFRVEMEYISQNISSYSKYTLHTILVLKLVKNHPTVFGSNLPRIINIDQVSILITKSTYL